MNAECKRQKEDVVVWYELALGSLSDTTNLSEGSVAIDDGPVACAPAQVA